MLVSRDEQSVLVVSYKDIKACIASAFAYVNSAMYLDPLSLNDFRPQGAVAEMSKRFCLYLRPRR